MDGAIRVYHDQSAATWCDLVAQVGSLNEPKIRSTHSAAACEELENLPRGIINPSGRRKICWDAFVCCCVVYLTMTMPYSMGFNAEASCHILGGLHLSDKPWRACIRFGIDFVVDLSFLLDMFFSCFTAYQTPTGALVGDPWKIVAHYLIQWHGFPVDFISTLLPYILRFCNIKATLTKITKFVRVIRLSKLFKLTRLMRLRSKKNNPTEEPSLLFQPGFVSAVRMLLTLFVIAHMLCCVHYCVAAIMYVR